MSDAKQAQAAIDMLLFKYDPNQRRDEEGQWAKVGGALDSLRLGGKIPLAEGETLVSSSMLNTSEGRVPMAVTRSGDGLELRLGIGVPDEDARSWKGANRGGTVKLDQSGVQALQAALVDMRAKGVAGEAEGEAAWDEAERLETARRDIVRRQYPNLTKTQARTLDKLDESIERETAAVDYLAEQLRQSETSGSGAGFMWRDRRAAAQRRLHEAQQERAQLVDDPIPLTAEDQRELDIATQRVQEAQRLASEITDGYVVSSGKIPTPWGDLFYETAITDTGPHYTLVRKPDDADDDWMPGDEGTTLTEGDLKKLGTHLEKTMTVARSVEVAR